MFGKPPPVGEIARLGVVERFNGSQIWRCGYRQHWGGGLRSTPCRPLVRS